MASLSDAAPVSVWPAARGWCWDVAGRRSVYPAVATPHEMPGNSARAALACSLRSLSRIQKVSHTDTVQFIQKFKKNTTKYDHPIIKNFSNPWIIFNLVGLSLCHLLFRILKEFCINCSLLYLLIVLIYHQYPLYTWKSTKFKNYRLNFIAADMYYY